MSGKIDLIVVKIVEMLDDSNKDVRTAAAQALSKFGKQGSSLCVVKVLFLTSLPRNVPECVQRHCYPR